MRSAFSALFAVTLAAALAGCGSSDEAPAPTTSATPTSTSASPTSSKSTAPATSASPSSAALSDASSQTPNTPAAEPTLLYCDEGQLTIMGMFSDGQWRPTEACDTPAHRHAGRAEQVCGGPNGLETYGQEYIDLCLGGVAPETDTYSGSESDSETDAGDEDSTDASDPASY